MAPACLTPQISHRPRPARHPPDGFLIGRASSGTSAPNPPVLELRMRRFSLLLSTVLVTLTAGRAFAQQTTPAGSPAAAAKPSFAGKWTLIPDSGAAPQPAGARGFAGL